MPGCYGCQPVAKEKLVQKRSFFCVFRFIFLGNPTTYREAEDIFGVSNSHKFQFRRVKKMRLIVSSTLRCCSSFLDLKQIANTQLQSNHSERDFEQTRVLRNRTDKIIFKHTQTRIEHAHAGLNTHNYVRWWFFESSNVSCMCSHEKRMCIINMS